MLKQDAGVATGGRGWYYGLALSVRPGSNEAVVITIERRDGKDEVVCRRGPPEDLQVIGTFPQVAPARVAWDAPRAEAIIAFGDRLYRSAPATSRLQLVTQLAEHPGCLEVAAPGRIVATLSDGVTVIDAQRGTTERSSNRAVAFAPGWSASVDRTGRLVIQDGDKTTSVDLDFEPLRVSTSEGEVIAASSERRINWCDRRGNPLHATEVAPNATILAVDGDRAFALARHRAKTEIWVHERRGSARCIAEVQGEVQLHHGEGRTFFGVEHFGQWRLLEFVDGEVREQRCIAADVSLWGLLADDRAIILAATAGTPEWHLRVSGPGEPSFEGRPLEPGLPAVGSSEAARALKYRTGHRYAPVGVLYVPSVGRGERAHAQTPFLQHVVSSIARSLGALDGLFQVASPLAPEELSQVTALEQAASRKLGEAARKLRQEGASRVVCVAASMGGYAALRAIQRGLPLDGLMLLNPVYWLDPVVRRRLGVRDLPADGNAFAAVDTLSGALSGVPTTVVHGLCDELSPAYLSARLAGRCPSAHYVAIADEGHVFTRFSSWRQLEAQFTTFFSTHFGDLESLTRNPMADCP